MRATPVIAAALLSVLFAATATVAWADEEPTISLSPETVKIGLDFSGADVTIGGTTPAVKIGLDFSGADVTIGGTTPAGADVVLVVDGPVDSVKMRKKGKVMGLFWMTVDQAEVEDMPAFHVVRSSEPIEHLLSRDQQVRLGVDPEASNILDQAQAVDPDDKSPISGEKQTEFVTALRDMYITKGQYTPWRCYHEAEAADCDAAAPAGAIIRPDDDGRWETLISLPSSAPLGDYSVQAHYVRDGQVVGSDATTFNVKKVGVVDSLGTMAQDNAPLYGGMALAIAIAMGLAIGFVFRSRAGH